MKKRALISLSDKTGAAEFAKALVKADYEIISTGGTAKVLEESGIEVLKAEDITKFPECLGGRVKTLHPMIHGGILNIRGDAQHQTEIKNLGIVPIDLVAVNLYPFKNTVLDDDSTENEIIENIDIGGPSMIRAAAKNFESVYILTDPADYAAVLADINSGDAGAASAADPNAESSAVGTSDMPDSAGATNAAGTSGGSYDLRRVLAGKAFEHCANYDAMISNYFRSTTNIDYQTDSLTLTFDSRTSLRYGENPHQAADYYTEPFYGGGGLVQHQGKEMSFNNYNDLTGAIRAVEMFDKPAVVAVKHSSPCGAAQGRDMYEAYTKAYECDPLSIFGGIVAFNGLVDGNVAEKLTETFLEIVYAEEFDEDALEVLSKKKNLRVIERTAPKKRDFRYKVFQKTVGGLLYQDYDRVETEINYEFVTKRLPSRKEFADLEFAMKVCASAKSNAIVIAKDAQTIGIGQGQVSRVFATRDAVENAVLPLREAVLASDAFFPFEDALEAAVKAGITAVIQPGGSKFDDNIIDFANEHGIAMIFTGRRHFRHGY